jgi:K+-sensing histidine kinase KdpD
MFNHSASNTVETGVSELKNEDKVGSMNAMIQSMFNCPTILTGISHEMRTHMNAIVAFSFLMNKDGYNDKEREEFSNQIFSSCEQLIGLFENFLDSAIIDTGNLQVDLKICKLDNILDTLLSEFREKIRKDECKDIVLVSENQFSNSTEVLIDVNRVTRVIHTLFCNSLINTNSGYIKIGYYLREEKVTFYVLDSGQGFYKCKEFLQTQNLNDSLSKHNDICSAINITLAKKLIQLLGGTIWIECNGQTGTGIYFCVPVKVIENSNITINKYTNSMVAI